MHALDHIQAKLEHEFHVEQTIADASHRQSLSFILA
jgi:hypothetical protein